jgi:polyhydroxybutyrate depolymerase
VIACKGSSDSGGASSGGASSSSSSSGDPIRGGTSGTGSPDVPPPPPAVNLTLETMQWNGIARTYFLGKPRTYDAARAYPLVVSFHGNPSSADIQAHALPFNASDQDAVLVYPQALQADSGSFSWDLYTATADNADMNWIKPLIEEVKKKANIDKNKVFGFGYSGGGFFISQYSCRFGGVFRAIASNAGGGPDEPNMGYPKRDDGCYICPAGPIPILVTHGEADAEVEVASGTFTADCYADENGCSGSRSASTPAPCEVYDGCSKPVKRCIIPGQSHALWGGATAEAWTFFKAAP